MTNHERTQSKHLEICPAILDENIQTQGTISLEDALTRKAFTEVSIEEDIEIIKVKTSSYIKTLHANITGILAIGLWNTIFLTGVWQTQMISRISNSVLVKADQPNQVINDFESYDKVSAMVNDTSKSLYAFLSPLATAITGFYFVLQSKKIENDDGK